MHASQLAGPDQYPLTIKEIGTPGRPASTPLDQTPRSSASPVFLTRFREPQPPGCVMCILHTFVVGAVVCATSFGTPGPCCGLIQLLCVCLSLWAKSSGFQAAAVNSVVAPPLRGATVGCCPCELIFLWTLSPTLSAEK
jgi:hypothetical protein